MNGELKLHCHDAATWRFPSFSGKVTCRGIDFHFWDAVDDLSKTDIDLVFDDQRLYMHNASGIFGSIPLTLSGEQGLLLCQGPAVLLVALALKHVATFEYTSCLHSVLATLKNYGNIHQQDCRMYLATCIAKTIAFTQWAFLKQIQMTGYLCQEQRADWQPNICMPPPYSTIK